jgi:two-component system chemotaxis sensor kinase CheA
MSEDAFIEEIQNDFLAEAAELLRRVEELSLNLEKTSDLNEIFSELARLAHNFKGSGQAVGFDHISKLGHRLEDFILAIKNKVVPSTPENLDFLFRCLDILKADVETLAGDKKAKLNHDQIFIEIDARISGKKSELKMSSDLSHELTAGDEPVNLSKGNKPKAEVLRIPKPKVDFFLESFGEQVILQSTLENCKFDILGNQDLILKTISQLTKLTLELQGHALSLSMVQIAPTFTKLERAARDAARSCNKNIEVILEGGDTEVDKTLIESLSDSLVHMVRNSVDHAIEVESDRTLAGKNSKGRVWIRARRTGGQLWIEVQDDGKGLNPKVIKEKAVKNGLLEAARAERMTSEEAYQLIFANGFSTKESVSEVSGRGVGMNVVLDSVSRLNGDIEIESEVGKGTLFRLKMPLSLAIFNGAVVGINGTKYIIPNSDISEIARYHDTLRARLDENRSAVRLRDRVFEIIDLRKKFSSSSSTVIELSDDLPLIIYKKSRKAFIVDEIFGVQKVVQKPLGEEVRVHPAYAAASILSDGSPCVILNLNSLAQQILEVGL